MLFCVGKFSRKWIFSGRFMMFQRRQHKSTIILRILNDVETLKLQMRSQSFSEVMENLDKYVTSLFKVSCILEPMLLNNMNLVLFEKL